MILSTPNRLSSASWPHTPTTFWFLFPPSISPLFSPQLARFASTIFSCLLVSCTNTSLVYLLHLISSHRFAIYFIYSLSTQHVLHLLLSSSVKCLFASVYFPLWVWLLIFSPFFLLFLLCMMDLRTILCICSTPYNLAPVSSSPFTFIFSATMYNCCYLSISLHRYAFIQVDHPLFFSIYFSHFALFFFHFLYTFHFQLLTRYPPRFFLILHCPFIRYSTQFLWLRSLSYYILCCGSFHT